MTILIKDSLTAKDNISDNSNRLTTFIMCYTELGKSVENLKDSITRYNEHKQSKKKCLEKLNGGC